MPSITHRGKEELLFAMTIEINKFFSDYWIQKRKGHG